jgi:hypothetical protein
MFLLGRKREGFAVRVQQKNVKKIKLRIVKINPAPEYKCIFCLDQVQGYDNYKKRSFCLTAK